MSLKFALAVDIRKDRTLHPEASNSASAFKVKHKSRTLHTKAEARIKELVEALKTNG